MSRPKLNVKEKVQKELPEFADEVASLSSDQLNMRLAELAKAQEQNYAAKEADEELEATRAKAQELAAPYGDANKVIRLKSRYIVSLLKESGNE